MVPRGNTNRIKLSDGKKLLLTKGHGWKDSYFEEIILPFLNGKTPPNIERVKSSLNARVWNACGEGTSIFMKFFNYRGVRDKFVFRKSRARRAMEGGMILLQKGFLVPTLIAQGDLIKGFRVLENFLITQWIEGSFNTYTYLKTFFKLPLFGEALQKKRNFIKAAGQLIGSMHKNGIFHGDLRPGNILIKVSDNDHLFYFIDNERTKYFPKGIPFRLREKNLVQINMILMTQITLSDRMRFFKAYLIENPGLESIEKRLIRRISLKTEKRLTKKISGIREKEDAQN